MGLGAYGAGLKERYPRGNVAGFGLWSRKESLLFKDT